LESVPPLLSPILQIAQLVIALRDDKHLPHRHQSPKTEYVVVPEKKDKVNKYAMFIEHHIV
jgi:hypothetical protein